MFLGSSFSWGIPSDFRPNSPSSLVWWYIACPVSFFLQPHNKNIEYEWIWFKRGESYYKVHSRVVQCSSKSCFHRLKGASLRILKIPNHSIPTPNPLPARGTARDHHQTLPVLQRPCRHGLPRVHAAGPECQLTDHRDVEQHRGRESQHLLVELSIGWSVDPWEKSIDFWSWLITTCLEVWWFIQHFHGLSQIP